LSKITKIKHFVLFKSLLCLGTEYISFSFSFIFNRSTTEQKNVLTVFYQVECALFYIGNDAEISPTHYTWKVAENGFKIAFMMNKLAMIISFEIILEKYK
jgi:hypothetical protein